jgi:hypothetical protein
LIIELFVKSSVLKKAGLRGEQNGECQKSSEKNATPRIHASGVRLFVRGIPIKILAG